MILKCKNERIETAVPAAASAVVVRCPFPLDCRVRVRANSRDKSRCAVAPVASATIAFLHCINFTARFHENLQYSQACSSPPRVTPSCNCSKPPIPAGMLMTEGLELGA
ncbi:hypothetical protein HaLaN_18746 [Haematococcus lacustris]|uniref:Uncharacterized protein n=1 Tax=Haematococcus lacustris TaxID=44745 RepID=A0A699ZP74_HAELA|nr:hypothetical protein HaLaN_18746 [Haematococcus lacustris]